MGGTFSSVLLWPVLDEEKHEEIRMGVQNGNCLLRFASQPPFPFTAATLSVLLLVMPSQVLPASVGRQ